MVCECDSASGGVAHHFLKPDHFSALLKTVPLLQFIVARRFFDDFFATHGRAFMTSLRWPSMIRLVFLLLLQVFVASGCSSITAAMKASPTLANAMGVADIPMEYLEEKYVNEDSKFVEVNGYKIHYRDVGEGDTIVLMHGIFSALQTWDAWVDELRTKHRVITLDMPGYGLTGGPVNIEDFDAANIVNTFAEFVDKIELDHFTLVGNSLGGYVAASYAAQFSGRVDKLILIDPFGYPQDVPWLLHVATFYPFAMIGNFVQPPLAVTLGVRWAYGDSRRIRKNDLYRYVQMSQRPGAKPIYIKTLKMIEAQAASEDPLPFHQIKAPTLLMWGEADSWVPIELAQRWLNDVPTSRLISYPGLGHIPAEESPLGTVKDAKVFLEQGLEALSSKTRREAKPQAAEKDAVSLVPEKIHPGARSGTAYDLPRVAGF